MALSKPVIPDHVKCRNKAYLSMDPTDPAPPRFTVEDGEISWEVKVQSYNPPAFTTKKVMKASYADDITNLPSFIWNAFDGPLNRTSFMGIYEIINGIPRNPMGRTGITGRGRLGRFGPNHAADPVVTRWKRDENGELVYDAKGKKMLEAVLIKRKDNGEWAIPGGMVETGDSVSETLLKELAEEAMAMLEEKTAEKRKAILDDVKRVVSKANEYPVYKGYVDDPRNTDNAWMETVCVNFHDEYGTNVGEFKLKAGDDAVGAQWTVVTAETKLYASHSDFICRVLAIHGLD